MLIVGNCWTASIDGISDVIVAQFCLIYVQVRLGGHAPYPVLIEAAIGDYDARYMGTVTMGIGISGPVFTWTDCIGPVFYPHHEVRVEGICTGIGSIDTRGVHRSVLVHIVMIVLWVCGRAQYIVHRFI